jgi:hypothetical protein
MRVESKGIYWGFPFDNERTSGIFISRRERTDKLWRAMARNGRVTDKVDQGGRALVFRALRAMCHCEPWLRVEDAYGGVEFPETKETGLEFGGLLDF